MIEKPPVALIAGIGPGLGSALCRELAGAEYLVAGLARGSGAGTALLGELDPDRFMPLRCDITDAPQVDAAVAQVEARFGAPDVYIHNTAWLSMAPFLDTNPNDFDVHWRVQCLGAVHGSRRVLPAMLKRGRGCLLLVGATASVKAGANFSAFGSAKFALRGLAQSLARELGPQGIHVAHLIIDGVIWSARARDEFGMKQEQCLLPESVARTCRHLIEQDRSAWTHELDIRPDLETF